MKNLIIVSWLFFIYVVDSRCQLNEKPVGAFLQGVIIVQSVEGKYDFSNDIEILNADKKIYATLKYVKEDENRIQVKYKSKVSDTTINNKVKKFYPENYDGRKYEIAIRAYYPDYSLVIFDAEKLNEDYYTVLVNGEKKVLRNAKNIKFYSWDYFLKKITFVGVNEKNPIRYDKSPSSSVIKDFKKYKNYSFQVEAIEGNWAKVKCSEKCNGCSNNVDITGWVKWRDESKLLVRLFYVCD